MIRADKLSLELGSRDVLHDVSFTISDGEKIGLVGNNGAGKTTLLKILVGQISSDAGKLQISGIRSKRVSYVPQYLSLDLHHSQVDVLTYLLEARGLPAIKERLQALEQQLEQASDPRAVSQILQEYQYAQQKYLDLDGYSAEDRVIDLLSGIGLDQVDLGQTVSTLSGGQKSRLAIARLLFEDSDVLLLDEPTNHLDEQAVGWLGDYLAESPQTVIAVSHLATFLDRFVRRILFLDRQNGTINSYSGTYSQVMQSRRAKQTSTERERAKASARIHRLEQYIQTVPLSKSGIKHSREKEIERLKTTMLEVRAEREAVIRFNPRVKLTRTVISTSGLTKSYGRHQVLTDVSLTLQPGDRLGIVGVNGAGKTTLLRILAGELSPDRGVVDRHPRLQIGWYEQEQEGLHDQLSTLQEARLVDSDMSEQQVRASLAHFMLADKIQQTVGTLSRGERNRLVMCKLMLARPNLLLLDEPTNHLDRPTQSRLKAALADYAGSIIIVSHDQLFLREIGVEWALHLPKGDLIPLDRLMARK